MSWRWFGDFQQEKLNGCLGHKHDSEYNKSSMFWGESNEFICEPIALQMLPSIQGAILSRPLEMGLWSSNKSGELEIETIKLYYHWLLLSFYYLFVI